MKVTSLSLYRELLLRSQNSSVLRKCLCFGCTPVRKGLWDRYCVHCRISMDYGNTKTPSVHRKLGSATLSQLACPGESNPNFPWEKSKWDNTVVKKSRKKSGLQASQVEPAIQPPTNCVTQYRHADLTTRNLHSPLLPPHTHHHHHHYCRREQLPRGCSNYSHPRSVPVQAISSHLKQKHELFSTPSHPRSVPALVITSHLTQKHKLFSRSVPVPAISSHLKLKHELFSYPFLFAPSKIDRIFKTMKVVT